MATVQITDIYNPKTFGRRTQEAQIKLNRFLSSGVAVSDGALAAQIAQGGNLHELTNYSPLTVGEPNYSSDDPTQKSVPANINTSVQRCRVYHRNKSWSTMDLSRELALQDPVGAITGRIGKYWAEDDEQRIINTFLGLLAGNKAKNSSDMLIDVATDDAAAVTDAERIGGERVLDALQTLGDHKSSITTLAMHSAIHTRLAKQGLIDYTRDADNKPIGTYMDKSLIIDDSLPAVAGANRITYTCILFAPGVIATAPGRVITPSELQREADAGHGGGQDILHSRIANVWHPIGFDFLSHTMTSVGNQTTATYAQLRLAANWDRKFQRKSVPIAFINVND